MKYALLALLAGCTDPVVSMHLEIPQAAMTMDTSCVTAIEVRAYGTHYPGDPNDFTRACLDITGANYQALDTALQGKFELLMPQGGLSGIGIYGWSGPSACQPPAEASVTPDLMFTAKQNYIGQDTIELPVQPNLSCSMSQVKVRMVDMNAMLAGSTPSSANCTTATMGDTANNNWVDFGTISPKLFDKGTQWFGGNEWAPLSGGLSTFMGYNDLHSKSCLGFDAGYDGGGSTSCAVGGTSVCGSAGDGIMEAAILPTSTIDSVLALDAQKVSKWQGVIVGEVWSNGTTKHPVSGADVQVDPTHGEIVYVDQGAAGAVTPRTGSSTGPSGLFVLYTDTVASVTITSGTSTRTVNLGAIDQFMAGAMIVMP